MVLNRCFRLVTVVLFALHLVACGGGSEEGSAYTSGGQASSPSSGDTSSGSNSGSSSGGTTGGNNGSSSGGTSSGSNSGNSSGGTTGGNSGSSSGGTTGGNTGSSSGSTSTGTTPGGSSGATAVSNTLTFPIEVLSDGSPTNPMVAEVSVGLDPAKVSSATQLWFQCHRCGFYASPEFEATTSLPRTVKASIRVIGGGVPANDASVPWIEVTDANVQLADAERVQGGVNGAFYTTRITLTLTGAMRASLVGLPSYNRIQFRFNGTDGASNGYRVLALEVRDQSGDNLITNSIAQADPTVERSVMAFTSADVSAGKALWYATNTLTKSSIVSRKLQAACNSCHAEDARDLQYFNYSNNSIVQRSRFHGLSAAQGQQIVAFVRTAQQQLPYAANARPWNPPYQPGPGLDCTGPGCETNWSAGAGLGAALETPAAMVNSLFGKPVSGAVNVSQADIDNVMNPAVDMNVRQMQVSMQFPDWNAWLPGTHPADIWPQVGNSTNSFNTGATFTANNPLYDPNGQYKALLAWLTANQNPNGVYGDWSHLTPAQRNTAQNMFFQFGWAAYGFLGGGRGNHTAASGQYGAQVGAANMQPLASRATMAVNAPGSFTTNAFIERAVDSMLHWNAVKQWEMAHEFGLEGNQKWFIGDYNATTNTWTGRGEAHGWPFETPGVFYLAPHMEYQADVNSSGQTTRQNIMAWQTNNAIGSYYSTNQWYQLAMTVNPGGRNTFSNYPMDWSYLTAFDDLVAQTLGPDAVSQAQAQMHYVREIQDTIKMAQYVDNNLALYDPTQPLIGNVGTQSRAEALKHLALTVFTDVALSSGVYLSHYRCLDSIQSGLYLKVINGFINQFNVLYAQTDPSAWRRCDPNDTSLGEPEDYAGFNFCLGAQRTPLGKAADGHLYPATNNLGQTTNEQNLLYSVYEATKLGAEPNRLQVMSDWVNRAWPPQ